LQTPTEEYDESENIQTVDLNIPSNVNDEVEGEIEFIESQDGLHDSPLFLYREDYSQYKPRGHYTQTKHKKEEAIHTKKQPQDTQNKDIYNTLSEDTWEKRKGKLFTTGI